MKLPILSGQELIKILVKKFGFYTKSQKGSHILLIKFVDEKKVGTVVPLHKELKVGTLRGILRQAKITPEDFLEKMK